MVVDAGNPNFFKTFKGRYPVESPNPSVAEPFVMLSCVNDVQFMCDFTADENGLLCVLPEECRPKRPVIIPCCTATEPHAIGMVGIETDGKVIGTRLVAYNMNGVSFHISDNWYNMDNGRK